MKKREFPIGTKAKMVKCCEAEKYPDKIWVTRSEPYTVCGVEVVLLEGKTGGFATKFLEIVEPLEPKEDYIEAACPNCGERFYAMDNECGKCGQPIKWPKLNEQ